MATFSDRRVFDLTEAIGRARTTDDVITRLVAQASAAVHSELGGLTVIESGHGFGTKGATEPVVEQADHLQYELLEGPCVDASTTSQSLMASNLATDPRWPRWGPAVSELGMRSVLSAEVHAGARRLGALNIYGEVERHFSTDDLDLLRVFASIGGAVLGFATSVDGLSVAVENRTVIGQAQGMVMLRYDVSADRAFAVLRRHSQAVNVKLVKVAEQLVASRGSSMDLRSID